MASLWISEFSNAEDGIPVQPPVAEQTVTIGGTSTQSAAFQATTNYVEISADNDCAVEFGTNPTAAFGGPGFLPENSLKLYRIPNDASYKLAVIESD